MNTMHSTVDVDTSPGLSLRQRRQKAVSIVEARIVFCAFLLTFVAARTLVHLMMSHRVPDMYLHLGPEQTHVHHLNYGIFLLSFIGAYMIFVRPGGRHLSFIAAVYGVAMGLTFDEFGMWYHLSGNYFQMISYEAVIVIGALFGLLAVAPELKRVTARGWVTAAISLMFVSISVVGLRTPFRHALQRWGPGFHHLHHFAVLTPTE